MEGLQRLIGRSIGGKVTTSVEMERTTHSKSNARPSRMFYKNQIRNLFFCQNLSLTDSGFGINWMRIITVSF